MAGFTDCTMYVVPALIFDMDGVIVDSTAIHTEAWIAYPRAA